MSFLAPLMLIGTAAALLPLLIHLFDRRRPRPHPFAAIAFVLKSQKRTASRLKLRRLLLYALRTLLLLAIPLALAKPILGDNAQAAAVTRGPAATSIVLDTSLSMRFSDGKSLFDRAKSDAMAALADLLPEEPANVVLCGPSTAPPRAPDFDRKGLREQLESAEVTYGASDVSRCLELGLRSLEEAALPSKRIVLVSDFTAGSLRLDRPAPTYKGPDGSPKRPEVVLRDAASGKEVLRNRAIVELRTEPAFAISPRAVAVSFTVRNVSPEPIKDLEAALRIGEQVVAKGFVDVPANGSAQKVLTHRFEVGGTYRGEVVLAPDGLTPDDRRTFVVTVPKELRALILNGSPSSVRYRDEAFFVEAALGSPGSPVVPTVRDADLGFREQLKEFDLIFMLNVPAPSAEDAARLTEFVLGGGGLFISVGDRVEADAYNERLGKLLPRRLRLVKTAANPEDPDGERKAARLTDVALDHPVLSLFTGAGREGLLGSRFYRYMLLESAASARTEETGLEVLATYEDGAPALTVSRAGRGRVLLFTSTADRDWSDFAIRTSFLPLMQRFSGYLAGALEERPELHARVGESVTLRPDRGEKLSELKTPSGDKLELTASEAGFTSAALREPGLYEVLDGSGKPVDALAFAATLDPAESDLTRIQSDQLTAYFGEETITSAALSANERTVPLWTWLIVAAVLAFFFEGVLLRK